MSKRSKRGGYRKVGRPVMRYSKQILVLDCTEKEIEQIRRELTTRERAELLLVILEHFRILAVQDFVLNDHRIVDSLTDFFSIKFNK